MKTELHQGAPPPDRYNLTVENKSGEEAPAYGILRVTNGKMPSEDGSYEINKPDGSSGTYWINSPIPIADDAFGAATNRFPTTVAYDDAETPVIGEEWGPVTGSWLLTKAGTGFFIVGTPADGLVRVDGRGGGGSSSVIGVMAMASDDIDSPTDQTWADVPSSVKSQVEGADDIDDAERCWQLVKGAGKLYQLVAEPGDGGFPAVGSVWMVPVSGNVAELYNMAGAVTAEHALQVKQFNVKVGGTTMEINVVDVEKCEDTPPEEDP